MKNQMEELVETLNSAPEIPVAEEYSDNDRMMGKAYEMAKNFLIGSNDRSLIPTFAMLTERGQLVIAATPFDETTDKDCVAEAMRKLMREAKVARYTFATEAWLAKVPKNDWESDKRPPSERDNRMEIVFITGADKSGFSVKLYEIVRDWESGRVTDLKPLDPEMTMDSFEGRFANLLA